jgi:hypothetical protein
MKIIAFYLPQFHCIPENDLWWGNGFTEWTNTKKAQPLFKGHYQPREPYNDNYYNLLDIDTHKWQAKIAKEYGVYGFCHYHYWFNGKQLLEKPTNLVLESAEPDFPFCLAWANEPWTKIWYAGQENEVLVSQEYGNKNDWKEHFEYLIELFKDKRYIKVENRPMFIIYRPESINCCEEMLVYWNELAKKYGFDGIYYVKMLTCFTKSSSSYEFDAQIEFEPSYTIKIDPPRLWNFTRLTRRSLKKIADKIGIRSSLLLDRVNYDTIWSHITSREPSVKKTFLGAFMDWDNSARKPFDPLIMDGACPEKFKKYIRQQIYRTKNIYNSEFLFINAWNEWAEGTYLEPDKKYGYQYLQALNEAISEND